MKLVNVGVGEIIVNFGKRVYKGFFRILELCGLM